MFLLPKKSKKVFLGGTCGTSTWREKIIPHLEIDYFNPIVPDWNEQARKEEEKQKSTSDYRLYVITPDSHSLYSIAEVVDDSNTFPDKTILTILRNTKNGEFTKYEIKSLEAISKLVRNNGARVFHSLLQTVDFLNSNAK